MFFSQDKRQFLIGESTYGHYQIEMACESCHSSPFGGKDVLQDACMNCHQEELDAAHDSHPKKKFTDPREAFRLAKIDARYCITCHTEHQREITHPMGVTLAKDYCFHCHEEVIEERESHRDLAFDSCASAGCHNFHDNRALYESFLLENADQPWLREIARVNISNASDPLRKASLSITTSQFPQQIAQYPAMARSWDASSHAQAGIDCGSCHVDESSQNWIEQPGIDQCHTCHERETKTYTQGKHGMRLAYHFSNSSRHLDPITPAESSMTFKEDASTTAHSCNTCHRAHDFNSKKAAVEGCLDCHADGHSLAYLQSPHHQLWLQETSGEAESGTGVSCATCHMPKTPDMDDNSIVFINHNQNHNLRPNEKMIRSVCMNCHGLDFVLNALADPLLIKNNFSGRPSDRIESIDWAKARDEGNSN